jgi:hypothetical protein
VRSFAPKSADPRTIGNCAIRAPRVGGEAGSLGTWEAGVPRGGAGRASPSGPDAAREWAQVRRAGAGHDDPHGAGRRCGGGERGMRLGEAATTSIYVASRLRVSLVSRRAPSFNALVPLHFSSPAKT